ncbi:lipo-like protein [Hydrogenophaga crassostreae]|uniref:Lipo-like protein n=2 Tax=Hydrogenophaga crassostreae TaxID=1763535 RepID=A0A167IQ65_9BURK|nr:YiiX/YebB-like N1pC/P60 family cysteine hydrolase [Hydrogenophaga crassostreae]AOW14566.1 lipo-like protein [Hydrogenophaga crassostreae]OAD43336.1 lipo-like protein [Hydrogenophaga crassostreae]
MRAWLGRALARYLGTPGRAAAIGVPSDIGSLARTLKPGDVILVEGTSRVSTAIKYLTQSTWSHAALYVGGMPEHAVGGDVPCVVEADISEGVRAVALSAFEQMHCRICRPVGLDENEVGAVCQYAIDRLGQAYDLKNVTDLARYLFPTPPVPLRWRRKMLALGSGDPTRAICSTLIAQAFQSVQYPILPSIETLSLNDPGCHDCVEQVLHVRHHSLFAPRDFDVSPYFEIIKPTLSSGFDHRALRWGLAPGGAVLNMARHP